jgi:3D (Asp-Asp-Asp) domain-containing protein
VSVLTATPVLWGYFIAQILTWRTFEATAYTAFCDTGCIGVTATGYDVRDTVYSPKGHRVVAVDPDVVPLGSLIEVRLHNGEVFTARALDTGGRIKGRRLDVLMETKEDALEFGRQDVKVRVLKEESE